MMSLGGHIENGAGSSRRFIDRLNHFLYTDFIFSPNYRWVRHLTYWLFHINIWALFWTIMNNMNAGYGVNLFNMFLWVPVFILFSYPMVYWAVPSLLLKGKVWQFAFVLLLWGIAGLFINAGFRTYVLVPIKLWMDASVLPATGFQAHSYLCMTTSAASPMIIMFYKRWTQKQLEWMKVQQERNQADLQLLKAQIHPSFFFNSLNSIHQFATSQPAKTPDLILKLSSLLSYMLYDCKAATVRLSREITMMKSYVDLEYERCHQTMDISWSVDGETEDHFIAPLLILPFLENAFKHGTTSGVHKQWLSVDIAVKGDDFFLKLVNSKDPDIRFTQPGAGIKKIQFRLARLYPSQHELRIDDEGDFFVVTLKVQTSDRDGLRVNGSGELEGMKKMLL